jgi:alkanesulfonate monooxygenase SsuD/methylene tetrahydromethanopterin reductase-like flavin-dependent oxidoreductase (luciferase family)
MNLGMFMMPLHSPQTPIDTMLAQDREAIILADELGFSEAWVGEHYTSNIEPIPNPLQFMATLIHQTRQIKFATGVLNLPQHHPATVAGDVAQFDYLSNGRFIMGIGPGGLVSDMELYGLRDKNRAEMTVESLEIIHKIWASDPPYNIKGKYWDVTVEATLNERLGFGPMLKPLQQPFPPVAISVMSPSSSTARQAGERGWSVVSANFIADRVVKSHWDQYVIGCANSGRPADRSQWRVARSVLVTDSDAQAADYLANEACSYAQYYDYMIDDMASFKMKNILAPSIDTPDADITISNCLDWMVLSGSPKTVLDKLIAFVDYLGGPFGTLLMTYTEWDIPAMHQRSMQLLASEVMPKLKNYCAHFDK